MYYRLLIFPNVQPSSFNLFEIEVINQNGKDFRIFILHSLFFDEEYTQITQKLTLSCKICRSKNIIFLVIRFLIALKAICIEEWKGKYESHFIEFGNNEMKSIEKEWQVKSVVLLCSEVRRLLCGSFSSKISIKYVVNLVFSRWSSFWELFCASCSWDLFNFCQMSNPK